MPYANDGAGDLEKLKAAFGEVFSAFGSVDNVLEAFGLADMPQAQLYGIMFGCIVFFCTVTAVMGLLFFGGSFQRMAEQAETGKPTLLTSIEARQQRALLLEKLLEGRERLKENYPPAPAVPSDEKTPLTKMLMNVAPDAMTDELAELLEENDDKENATGNPKKTKDGKAAERYIPPYYEENYVGAYRKCQDRPGGSVLSGRPEARFEAYARGFAACGPYTSLAYRRSYGRTYENICCASHRTDDKYIELFNTRPYDIIGRHTRLEALEASRHLDNLHRITSGGPTLAHKAFDPNQVWGFFPEGPFDTPQDMAKSSVFVRKIPEASFAIIDSVTDRLAGAILLTKDNPENLTIQMEPPIMVPDAQGTPCQLEACFLLMDRLFGYGYRRIQISTDSQDGDSRKLASRLGFTLEGVLYKDMVVKDANRDSNMYGMLNSDWKRGARAALYKKLHGDDLFKVDAANEKREEEFDQQQAGLAKKKAQEAAAASKKDN